MSYRGCEIRRSKFLLAHLAQIILADTDNFNQILQGTQMKVIDVQVISRSWIPTLQSLRMESKFNLFWSKFKKFAREHNNDKPRLPRLGNAPIRCILCRAVTEHPEETEGDYHRKYYTALKQLKIIC